jgi:hypothetical protein
VLTSWELVGNKRKMKNPSFTFTPCKLKKYIGAMLSLLIWLSYIAERRTNLPKHMGLK